MRAIILSAVLALSGCPETLLPDIRIRTETEARLGQPVVEILDRHDESFAKTRYTAETKSGKYSCLIYGGHALDLGIIGAVTCRPVPILALEELSP